MKRAEPFGTRFCFPPCLRARDGSQGSVFINDGRQLFHLESLGIVLPDRFQIGNDAIGLVVARDMATKLGDTKIIPIAKAIKDGHIDLLQVVKLLLEYG